MIDTRLSLACNGGGLKVPEGGEVLVLQPPDDAIFSTFQPAQTKVLHDFKPSYDTWNKRGFGVVTRADGRFGLTLLCLPRAKSQARSLFAQAMTLTDGYVVVDGQKTDGVDSLLRQVRRRHKIDGQVIKAHGKLFWCVADAELFADWAEGPALTAGGFWTAPGVFSADGIDPASATLAAVLPDDLGPRVADFGAGWGFLSAHVLTRSTVENVDLVEAGYMALECAKRNVTDPRARFYWADATTWRPDETLDSIVMNPPFHVGRAAEPSLGQAFISAASRVLKPKGALWMVANRHLPYEACLSEHFADVTTLDQDDRFKVFRASRPKRKTGR